MKVEASQAEGCKRAVLHKAEALQASGDRQVVGHRRGARAGALVPCARLVGWWPASARTV